MTGPAILGVCGGTDDQRAEVIEAVAKRFGFVRAAIVDRKISAVSIAPGYVLTVNGADDDETVRAADGYIVAIESDEGGAPNDVEPDMIVYWDGDAEIIADHVGMVFGLLRPGLVIGEDKDGKPVVAIANVLAGAAQ